ncbi:hypothetical protein BON30_29475 [Cystobacter ferrugineus]|uniref:Uncharacterized protein n=1 Tax=Cystobacter ferrugineus TaxID=83449 RepID=A0A1L9B585_9BACT|nr:hypothetical protein BON30_29475 [Cystobacter ferrugineus]
MDYLIQLDLQLDIEHTWIDLYTISRDPGWQRIQAHDDLRGNCLHASEDSKLWLQTSDVVQTCNAVIRTFCSEAQLGKAHVHRPIK